MFKVGQVVFYLDKKVKATVFDPGSTLTTISFFTHEGYHSLNVINDQIIDYEEYLMLQRDDKINLIINE